MDNPRGRVVSLVDNEGAVRAIVEFDAAPLCPRCAAGRGCGAALFDSRGLQRLEASVPDGCAAREGDVVEVSLAQRNLLRAALIVYGLPMFGALIGAGLAYGLSLGDSGAALAALLGLATGCGISYRRLRSSNCLRQFTPSIERIC